MITYNEIKTSKNSTSGNCIDVGYYQFKYILKYYSNLQLLCIA